MTKEAKEKIRVFALARELNLESKDLLAMCRAHGIDVKNQLSTVEPEVREQIEQLVKRGSAAAASAKTTAAPVLPKPMEKVRVLDSGRSRTATQAPPVRPSVPAPAAEVALPTAEPQAPAAAGAPEPVSAPSAPPTPPVSRPAAESPAPIPTPLAPAVQPPAAPPVAPAPLAPAASAVPPPAEPTAQPPAAPATPPTAPPSPREAAQVPPRDTPPAPVGPPRLPTGPGGGAGVRDLNAPRGGDGPAKGAPAGGSRRPPGTMVVRRPTHGAGKPPPGKTPATARKPAEPVGPKKIAAYDKSMLEKTKGPLTAADLLKPKAEEPAPVEIGDEEEGKGKGDKGKGGDKKKPSGVPGRDARQRDRNLRAEERKKRAAAGGVAVVGGKLTVLEEEERTRGRRPKLKKKPQRVLDKKPTRAVLDVPITVRALCEALGIKSVELLFKLKGQGVTAPTINTNLNQQTAELIALEYGVELEVRRAADVEEKILEDLARPDAPEDLIPRAPIVTIMGHVDHGKTSLLDRIRQQYGVKSDVVSTETGGITQVIRAWRVEKDGKPVTFLDTPGHEAFTKMRARGANVTDIAVIVVAADDGVMPQTEEAIAHAKAAGVSLVVAINKVDLPSANINRTRQQLYGLDVLPDNMGGDTPFIETSATTGRGIDELLEQLSVVAELKELKANPGRPARGTCLEAKLTEGEGVVATLLVQNGTLHRGDVILCGATFGRVRQMYNDMGQPIQEAGPSVPVRLTGLDEIPDADDPFVVLPDLALARSIAIRRQARRLEASLHRRAPLSLDQLTESKIAELKVILKADFRGSVEAIRKELEKLQHEEVRVRVLEAGIGHITENDVWLALTSPQDTLIVGFNAVPDDRAKALAEEKGLKILQYDIIYNLTNDIRSALEGKLKPREEVVYLGRAVVRETFKISRVGTVAGCHVTQGVIERSAKVRVIRGGAVIYPPPDRTASLESLKRFKDDAREVREGYECGLKIAGYDDIKVDDIIEAYRVEEVKRTL